MNYDLSQISKCKLNTWTRIKIQSKWKEVEKGKSKRKEAKTGCSLAWHATYNDKTREVMKMSRPQNYTCKWECNLFWWILEINREFIERNFAKMRQFLFFITIKKIAPKIGTTFNVINWMTLIKFANW